MYAPVVRAYVVRLFKHTMTIEEEVRNNVDADHCPVGIVDTHDPLPETLGISNVPAIPDCVATVSIPARACALHSSSHTKHCKQGAISPTWQHPKKSIDTNISPATNWAYMGTRGVNPRRTKRRTHRALELPANISLKILEARHADIAKKCQTPRTLPLDMPLH